MAHQVPHVLVTGVRLRPDAEPTDVRIRHGSIVEIGPWLTRYDAQVHDGGGALALPGLWDGHVHFGQWAAMTRRVDLVDTTGPEDVTARIARQLTSNPQEPGAVVQGFGWRVAGWDRLPTTAELDALDPLGLMRDWDELRPWRESGLWLQVALSATHPTPHAK